MLKIVCRAAKKYGVRIALENQIDAKGIGGRWMCGHPRDMEDLFDRIDNLGLNLDSAHACAQQLDIPSLVRWAGNKLYGLHISDSDGLVHDYHVIPGKGKLNWDEIMKALGESPYDGDFNLEIVHERKEERALSLAVTREAKKVCDNLLKIIYG
jgi:sugar phosphate isomerase/epimerase